MKRSTCRACGGARLEPILDLGSTPLANRLLEERELALDEQRFPLELVFCSDCTLVQITETVAPEVLFREYVYFSSFSDTMVAHAKELADAVIEMQRLGPESLVVEAASNDGYLLKHYHATVRGNCSSFCDSVVGGKIGHTIASAGSFHRTPRAAAGS